MENSLKSLEIKTEFYLNIAEDLWPGNINSPEEEKCLKKHNSYKGFNILERQARKTEFQRYIPFMHNMFC